MGLQLKQDLSLPLDCSDDGEHLELRSRLVGQPLDSLFGLTSSSLFAWLGKEDSDLGLVSSGDDVFIFLPDIWSANWMRVLCITGSTGFSLTLTAPANRFFSAFLAATFSSSSMDGLMNDSAVITGYECLDMRLRMGGFRPDWEVILF
jgi:hypothetical protein